MSSFVDHFTDLPDPRVERTKQHKLSDILFITVATVLSGCDDWNAIELYGEAKEEWLRKYLELPHGIPSTIPLTGCLRPLMRLLCRPAF